MIKPLSLFLMLFCFSFAILAQENQPKVRENHFLKIDIVEFATDTICVREPRIIKIAKTIKLTIPPHTDSILLSNQKDFSGAKWQKADSVMYWQMMPKQNQPFYYQLKFANKKPEIVMIIPYEVDCGGCHRDSKLIIDMNREYATMDDVTLYLFSYQAKYMMISNDSSFKNAKWQLYDTEILWKLTEGQGFKTVYAKFRDDACSLSLVVKDEIILDTEPPKVHKIKLLTEKESEKIFGKTNHNLIYLHLKVNEAYILRIGNITDIRFQKWQKMEEFIAIENQWGKQPIYIQFRDYAGNMTEILPLNN